MKGKERSSYRQTNPDLPIRATLSKIITRLLFFFQLKCSTEKKWAYISINPGPKVVQRFLSTDPLAQVFPMWSTYAYTLDNPVLFIDPDGRSAKSSIGNSQKTDGWSQTNIDLANRFGVFGNGGEGYSAYANPRHVTVYLVNNTASIFTKNQVVSDEEVEQIYQNAISVFRRSGFSEDLFSFVLVSPEKAKQHGASKAGELFIALVNEQQSRFYQKIGLSEVLSNGKTKVWEYNHYSSYINTARFSSTGSRSQFLYHVGYVLAHEMFHQLIYKSDLALNNTNPLKSEFSDHYGPPGYPFNLNTTGGAYGLDNKIKQGRGNDAELMLDIHWNLLRRYFYGG